MKKIILIMLGLLCIIGILILIILKSPKQEKYFNRVVLNDNNVVLDYTDNSYYDTILKIGLDELKIKNEKIVLLKLTDQSKSQFTGGELKAHIRYHEGVYYLFIDECDRDEAIDIISHEIIHITQYYTGKLTYLDNQLSWDGRIYDLNDVQYENRPWEIEAFYLQKDLSNSIKQRLYN